MTMSEYRRHLVFQWCDQNMEPETAEAMMEMLPNVNWSDIATKADLDALGTSLRGEVKYDIAQATRTMVLSLIASQATLVGLVLAATRLG